MKSNSDKKYLLISIILHVSLFLVMTVKVYFFPMERPEFIRSVRVDLVALPDKDPEEGPQGAEKPPAEVAKTKEEAKKKPEEAVKLPPEKPTKKEKVAKKEKPKKPESKKEDTKALTKDRQNSALKRLEALAKIKKMNEIKKDAAEGKAYKGNQLSEGNSLTGIEKIQHDQYLSQLDQHIKKNWQLPEWLSQKNLTAAVLVRFDESGSILEKRLTRSSGNTSFDNQALQSITISAPLPPPPENLVSYFKVRGIELRFPE
jgi:colicin import membrane protein